MMNSLGIISSLQEAHLEDALVMVSDITELLVQSKGLKVLTLKNIVLQGVKEHFNAYKVALYHGSGINKFSMVSCISALEELSLESLELL
jgi:hypothetical protein